MAHTHTLAKMSMQTVSEEAQVLDLLDKIVKSALLNTFKEPKETTPKAAKGETPGALAARWRTRRAQPPHPHGNPDFMTDDFADLQRGDEHPDP